MSDGDKQIQKLAIITELVKRAPAQFGRTALMKCLYFLKTLRNVPLSYSFGLYTYGPFDADVLDDLRYAESLGAIESAVVHYSNGYGYQFEPGLKAEEIIKRASKFVSEHENSIEWVISEFGHRSASDLEMISALVYIDRAFPEIAPVSISQLAREVHDVKPHLAAQAIEREAANLRARGLLRAVA